MHAYDSPELAHMPAKVAFMEIAVMLKLTFTNINDLKITAFVRYHTGLLHMVVRKHSFVNILSRMDAGLSLLLSMGSRRIGNPSI